MPTKGKKLSERQSLFTIFPSLNELLLSQESLILDTNPWSVGVIFIYKCLVTDFYYGTVLKICYETPVIRIKSHEFLSHFPSWPHPSA